MATALVLVPDVDCGPSAAPVPVGAVAAELVVVDELGPVCATVPAVEVEGGGTGAPEAGSLTVPAGAGDGDGVTTGVVLVALVMDVVPVALELV